MSDKTIYSFFYKDNIENKYKEVYDKDKEEEVKIESRGYKKAVKSFQNTYANVFKEVIVKWVKNGVELSKLQKLPMGRKKKLEG